MFALDQTRARRGLARWVTRWQAFLFFPMLALEGWNLHIASLQALRGRAGPPASWKGRCSRATSPDT